MATIAEYAPVPDGAVRIQYHPKELCELLAEQHMWTEIANFSTFDPTFANSQVNYGMVPGPVPGPVIDDPAKLEAVSAFWLPVDNSAQRLPAVGRGVTNAQLLVLAGAYVAANPGKFWLVEQKGRTSPMHGWVEVREVVPTWTHAQSMLITSTFLPERPEISFYRFVDGDGMQVGATGFTCWDPPPPPVIVIPPEVDLTPDPPPEPEPKPGGTPSAAGELVCGEGFLVGVPYDSFIETLDLAQTNQGNSLGRRQAVARVRVHLLETSALRIGPDEGRMREVPFRQFENLGAPPEPYSGYQRIPIPREWNSNGRIRVESVDPHRMEILSVMPDTQIGDE